MKPGTCDVKIREAGPDGKKIGKVVGVASYEIFDTVAEASAHLGEDKTLDLINAQHRTNELNRVRGVHRPGGISKTALRNEAMKVITGEEWMTVAGNPAAMDALIEKKMEEIKTTKLAENSGVDGEEGEQD